MTTHIRIEVDPGHVRSIARILDDLLGRDELSIGVKNDLRLIRSQVVLWRDAVEDGEVVVDTTIASFVGEVVGATAHRRTVDAEIVSALVEVRADPTPWSAEIPCVPEKVPQIGSRVRIKMSPL